MKKLRLVSIQMVVAVMAISIFSACDENPEITPEESILPEAFSVEIPLSLSNENALQSGRISGRLTADTLDGNRVYAHLNTFVAVGHHAARLTEAVILGIRRHDIRRPLSLTYESDDDHRQKKAIVEENVEFEGEVWQYLLTVYDLDSDIEPDSGIAMQVFWNRNPIKGIAILKPRNIDRARNSDAIDAKFRVDYSEGGEFGYERHMIVSISRLPVPSPLDNPFALRNLKMFVGKTGEVIEVYGNSNHPNAIIFSGEAGFNWAFVASGDRSEDIAVAEVGLPPSDLDSESRDVILGEYSIKNVFTAGITGAWPDINQEMLELFLSNTNPPGYFDQSGFISGGISPGPAWDVHAENIKSLTPYNPIEVSNLVIEFKTN